MASRTLSAIFLDEDKAEDLDGDGATTQMRVKSPNGTFKMSREDPRSMVPRGPGETGGEYYLVLSEGIDNDADGSFNEDGVGGIDMNRNFPRTWALPYMQNGAGAFPLSEPETRATLDFIVAHPNITGIVHNRKFTQQNPPSAMLEAEIAMKVPWFTEMAMVSPLIAIRDAKATALGGGLFRVEVEVENTGYMPTNITSRAIKAELAKPVRASLKLTGAKEVDIRWTSATIGEPIAGETFVLGRKKS